MKTIFALLLGLTLFMAASTVDAQVVVSRRIPRYYYPVAVQNSVYRTYFAAPYGYYYDNLGRLVPSGFRYNSYGYLVRRVVVVEPTVTFGVWDYAPGWRLGNPWWR